MRRWLRRLAFSFIVIAAVLAWEVHKQTQDGTMGGVRRGLYIAGAVVCIAAGLAGIKERHRSSRDP